MVLWQWLQRVTAETVATAAGFQPSWRYVLTVLLLPTIIGLLLAGVLGLVEKIAGRRLNGGSL